MIWFSGEEFWSAGSGQGWLEHFKENKKSTLLLTFHKDYGFHLEIKFSESPPLVSLGEGEGDFEQTVKTHVCGDPWILPTKFFVTRGQTWQAVEQFCKTGTKTDAITWGDKRKINWHYGYD